MRSSFLESFVPGMDDLPSLSAGIVSSFAFRAKRKLSGFPRRGVVWEFEPVMQI